MTYTEADTRAELIDPALKQAGWGVVDASRRTFTDAVSTLGEVSQIREMFIRFQKHLYAEQVA